MLTEVFVSGTALLYGMFLVTFYSSLNDTLKMFWRLVVHPLYFEVFMMLPIRYLVSRKMKYSECNILYSLSVVHAQSHTSTIGRMMFSTLDHLSNTAMSIVLLNIGKFFFRLTSPLRDSLVQKLVDKDPSINCVASDLRKKYIVASGIQTEIILENSCAIFAGITMWLFQKDKTLFMFPYPKGHLGLEAVIFTVLVQLAFALLFDSMTLYVAQKYLQLPVLETWQAMWRKKFKFFGFLLYGLVTMGVIGVFYMGLRVPRIMFCSSESVCSCVWITWMHTDCATFVFNTAGS